MPGFNSVKDLVDADVAGATLLRTWRKAPSQTTAAGFWFDLSMSPGNPAPQYYAAAPLIAKAMSQSEDGGLGHGGSVSPSYKFLRRVMAMTTLATAVPMPMILCDYLMYYPFIDEGTTDPQALTSITLPRYSTGSGVRIMPIVVAAGAGGAGVTFFCTYTNQDGTGSRVTPTVTLSTQIVTGTVATTSQSVAGSNGPFIPLQAGDSGVRSIQSVTFNGATDVGLITLVLVKPLAQMSIRSIDAPVEVDYFINCGLGMPRIVDDAYLNFICHPGGTLAAGQIHGTIETVFG